MKWVKRILVLMLTLLVLLLIGGAIGYRLSHARPDWYGQAIGDPQQREEAASRVEDALVNAGNWSAEAQIRRQRDPTAPSPDDVLELSFTEEQLNAIVSKWDELAGSRPPFAEVSAPQIMLSDGQMTLAATSRTLNLVVSVRLAPQLDEKGELHMEIVQVACGRLSLPRAVWGIYARRLAARIAAQLPGDEARAKQYADGSVSDAMVTAALSRMMLHFLNGESSPPILFIPYVLNNRSRYLPVKVQTLRIENKTAMLTMTPLPAGEKIDGSK